MAHKLRSQYPGVIHHVTNRSDRSEPIFKDEADHACFRAALGEVCAKTCWQVQAICLMPSFFYPVAERQASAKSVSNASELLPDPLRPVMTLNRCSGRSRSKFLRLLCRTPRAVRQK